MDTICTKFLAHLIAFRINGGWVLNHHHLCALLCGAWTLLGLLTWALAVAHRSNMITDRALHRLGAMCIHQSDLTTLAHQVPDGICLRQQACDHHEESWEQQHCPNAGKSKSKEIVLIHCLGSGTLYMQFIVQQTPSEQHIMPIGKAKQSRHSITRGGKSVHTWMAQLTLLQTEHCT